MSKKGLSFLFFTLFLLGTKAGFAENITFYQPLKISIPPQIDGVLDEKVWQEAKRRDGFVSKDIRGTGKGLPSSEQTIFSILYDEENLYFGIECKEPRTKQLVAKHTKHDDRVWEDDCIEIFIDTNWDKTFYYQFVVNSLGVRFELNSQVSQLASAWDAPWQAKTKIGQTSWYVEIAIPFSSLGMRPKKETVWGLSVCREHRAGEHLELSGWPGPYFDKEPEKYGCLIWNPLACLQKTILPSYEKKYKKQRKEILKAIKTLKSDDKGIVKNFNQVDAELNELIASGFKKETIGLDELNSIYHRLEMLLNNYSNIKDKILKYKCPRLELWL